MQTRIILLKSCKSKRPLGTVIDQIMRKEYPAKLAEYTGEILLVGINYNKDTKQHTCKIERME